MLKNAVETTRKSIGFANLKMSHIPSSLFTAFFAHPFGSLSVTRGTIGLLPGVALVATSLAFFLSSISVFETSESVAAVVVCWLPKPSKSGLDNGTWRLISRISPRCGTSDLLRFAPSGNNVPKISSGRHDLQIKSVIVRKFDVETDVKLCLRLRHFLSFKKPKLFYCACPNPDSDSKKWVSITVLAIQTLVQIERSIRASLSWYRDRPVMEIRRGGQCTR